MLTEPADFLGCLRLEATAFSETLHTTDLAQPIENCPGWTAADLGRHLGGVHRWATASLHTDHYTEPPEGPVENDAVPSWYDESASRLVAALGETDPDSPAWHFGPRPRTAEFWFRRQALETATHRWDLENADGTADPIDEALARAGILEVRDVFVPRVSRGRVAPTGLLRLLPSDGLGRVEIGQGEPEATISGTASDLFLFAWGRRALSTLAVDGDPLIAERHAEFGFTP